MLEHIVAKKPRSKRKRRFIPKLSHELTDVLMAEITRQSDLLRIVVNASRLKSGVAGRSLKTHSDKTEKKIPILSSGYKSRFTQKYIPLETFYKNANVYELHYGAYDTIAKKSVAVVTDNYVEGKNKSIEQEDDATALNPEQANNTIQRIIYAKLFGALSDIGIEDRERFTQWRQFNKHLRRLYEGGHYDSSITKGI
ncbi:MAG TPA: hypothetical protein VJH88_01300 [Candidatus Nanoarchaeia archaeon]|nr:hypothetical protein [Candidatus Nanoarchaeia archaeon]